MSAFTQRQEAAWPRVLETLAEHGIHATGYFDHQWHIRWSEETRPGRGRFFDGLFCDGEFVAQVQMDVYGGPTISIATVDWIHADQDEALVCETCTPEAEA